MSTEQLSQNEMDALMQDDSLLPDYGEIPQKEVISIFIRSFPLYLREGLNRFAKSHIGISHLQVVVKNKEELLKDNDDTYVTFIQNIKDPRFKGEVIITSTVKSALKMSKVFLNFTEDAMNSRALKELQSAFNSLNDGIFSLIENDYGKSIPLAPMVSEETNNPKSLITTEDFFVEISLNMTVASVSCPFYFILPLPFGMSIAKLIEQEIKQDLNIKTVRPVQFSPLDPSQMLSGEDSKINILLDVSMQLTAELGRTRIKIRDILGLGEGSIIELQKLAGEAIDVLINGKVIAKGEVVVIDEYFGVRLTEIESSKEIVDSMNLMD